MVLITIATAACPATGNINNLLAGISISNLDSVTFTVNPNSPTAMQTYNYNFQNNFASSPRIAIGTSSFTQPSKVLPSTLSDPTCFQSILQTHPGLQLFLPLTTPIEFGQASKSASGLVSILTSKSETSMLVSPLLFQPLSKILPTSARAAPK